MLSDDFIREVQTRGFIIHSYNDGEYFVTAYLGNVRITIFIDQHGYFVEVTEPSYDTYDDCLDKVKPITDILEREGYERY